MPRRTLAAAAVAAVLGGGVLAATASGQDAGRTIELTGGAPAKRDVTQVDVRPRGMSIGDEYIAAQTLRSGGRVAGRVHVVCTLVDRSYAGQDCRITLLLADGQISATGGGLDRPVPGVGDGSAGADGDPFAITGGTGAYDGAAGTLLVKPVGVGSRLTVSLAR
jgi:hypothetical protein